MLLHVKDTKNKGFEIDISANKILDVYNSKLLLTYAQLDERFHALALILKDWNKKQFPDRKKRLNSYSLVLMLTAFLQSEKVLPNLHTFEKPKEVILLYKKYNRTASGTYRKK